MAGWSFFARSSLILRLFSLHCFLLRSFAFNGPKHTAHALIIGAILLNLFLLLNNSQESRIFAQLPNGALPLLLVLIS